MALTTFYKNGGEIPMYKDIIKFIDDDIYKVFISSNSQPVVKVDATDHIYFKCRKCGAYLILQRIGIDTFMEDDGEKVKVRFHFICPECGATHYTKYYQPDGYTMNIKKNTEKLFVKGVKKGWIGRFFENMIDYVKYYNYSQSVLREVGLTKKKLAWFKRLFKYTKEGKIQQQ